jgi:hypothetical protein
MAKSALLAAAPGAVPAPARGAGVRARAPEPQLEQRGPVLARTDTVTRAPALPQETSLTVDLEALAYGRLRMPSPSEPGRGSLVAASAVSLYMEAIGSIDLRVDIFARIRVATQLALSFDEGPPAGHEIAQRTGDFDYAYRAAAPVDVPSDGAFHVVQVGAFSTEAKMRHVTVPRESQDVFRVVEVASPLDAALLRGPMDVYRGGTYLMTTRVPPTPPRGRVRLGLGVEQGIKVARNTTFAEKSTGLLGGGLALQHDVEVDLVNATDRPAEIEVRERVPIAREDDKEIEVLIDAVDPSWAKWTQENTLRGGHRWTIALDPGEKRKLSARYVVRIAAKHELVGGNRREA